MEEQFVYCGSPHYELHGKPMNNIKFLSNKKLTCKFFNIYIFFLHLLNFWSQGFWCWCCGSTILYMINGGSRNLYLEGPNKILFIYYYYFLYTRTESRFGDRWSGFVVGYMWQFWPLALLLLSHLRDFFFFFWCVWLWCIYQLYS